MEREREDRIDARQRNRDMFAARKAASQGDLGPLMELDPEAASRIQGQIDERGKTEAVRRANIMRYAAAGLARPDASRQDAGRTPIYGLLQQAGIKPPSPWADPEEHAAFRQQIEGLAAGQLGAEPMARQPSDAIAERLQLERGLAPGTSEFRTGYSELAEQERRDRLARASAVGGGQLAATMVAQTQGGIAEGEELLANLGDIKSLGDPSKFLGLRNKVKTWTLGAIAEIDESVLSGKEAEQLGKAREFQEGVEELYLAGKKEITGVAAGVREVREIRRALLNTDMSAPEFKASFDRLERVTRRNIEIKRRLLSQGINLRSESGRSVFSAEIEKAQASESAPIAVDKISITGMAPELLRQSRSGQ